MLNPQSLGRPVSREVGWEDVLDPGRPSDYSPSMNDPEVPIPSPLHGPVADAVTVPATAAVAVAVAVAAAVSVAAAESDPAD